MTWRRDPPRPEECPSWWWYREGSRAEIVHVIGAREETDNELRQRVKEGLGAGESIPFVARMLVPLKQSELIVEMGDDTFRIDLLNGEWSGPLRQPEE